MARRIFETATNSYTDKGVIGGGGAGIVHQIEDNSGQIFALKLLRATDSTKLKRFKNELFFCLKNRHERIVRVVDFGACLANGKQPFYIMPLYSGSLRTEIKRGIQPDAALKMFNDILDGVEAAHLEGIVHRDLKPENLLVDDARRVVIADFGIAHFREENLATQIETSPGERLANFKYRAPEQDGSIPAVDHRVDIFALGLILCEMFTGKVPHGTEHLKVKDAAPDYAYLDVVVEQMIRQDPNGRPSSIQAVKDELNLRGTEFFTRQKLDRISRAVVPACKSDDPLRGQDVHASSFYFQSGKLWFRLEPPPPPKWRLELQHLESYRAIDLSIPSSVQIDEAGVASFRARPDWVEHLVPMIREWVLSANAAYRRGLEREAQEKERFEREELSRRKREIEEDELANERIRRTLGR